MRHIFSGAALSEPLGRREYLTIGLSLMALKYAVDAVLIYLGAGVVWTPLDYLVPLMSLVGPKVAQFPSWLNFVLLAWTAPFVWIGVTLGVRRALSAGVSPWWVIAFFLPVLNYAFMAIMALLPVRMAAPRARRVAVGGPLASRTASFLAGAAAGAAIGLAGLALSVMALGGYGLSLFLGMPFVMGAVAGFVASRLYPHPVTASVLSGVCAGVLLGVMLVAVSLEGAICLLMAAPLAVPILVLGSVIGHRLGERAHVPSPGIALIIFLLPTGSVLDVALDSPTERVVLSAIEIDAPPDRVWPHVITFGEIAEPPLWYFRLGLAYPLRARMIGEGAGAVRLCEFTTGAFREPITAWEAPTRLAFDVTAQPPPLEEWSPYSRVYAPHQQDYFRTSRGEFRLIALPGGRTRLEGRTWYSLRMYPAAYWTTIADRIIHDIHERVLRHIERQGQVSYRLGGPPLPGYPGRLSSVGGAGPDPSLV